MPETTPASRPALIIGDKKYSTWSMRPWLALTVGGIAFDEVMVKLRTEGTRAAILRVSPSGKVPALRLGDVVIGESIAICEWAAENSTTGPLLPADPLARALCRAAAAEMHAGFSALRQECPMDMLARFPGHQVSDQCRADIARIQSLWEDLRARFGAGGPYLFGAWSIADAMFAPVVSRFISYDIALSPVAGAYVEAASSEPAYAAWVAGAALEG